MFGMAGVHLNKIDTFWGKEMAIKLYICNKYNMFLVCPVIVSQFD